MPTFELTGPDGGRYQVDAADEAAALGAFQSFTAKQPTGTPNDVVRAVARGVPVVGGLLNKAEAATNATLAPLIEPLLPKGPDTLDQPTWQERYQRALDIQEGNDKRFTDEYPITSKVLEVGGGVAGLAPVVGMAPGFFGAVGTVPQMVRAGATSGALVGGVDALTRGSDVPSTIVENALTGALAGPAGRLIGKTFNTVTRKPLPLEPQNVEPVAGVDVPIPPQDPVAASKLEIARRGGAGDSAQRVMQDADALTQARLTEAQSNIGASLDPTGQVRGTLPQAAAERVSAELGTLEQGRAAAEQALADQALQGTTTLRQSLGVPNAPVIESPYSAGESLSQAIREAAEASRAQRTAAYRAKSEIPGEYAPQSLQGSGQAIRQILKSGPDPVRVSDRATPNASEALNLIDETIGGLPPTVPDRAAPTIQVRDPATGQFTADMGPAPMTGEVMEDVRKQLNILYADARRAARAPGGSAADERAMGRVIDAFDQHLSNIERAGGFSGDVSAIEAARSAARAAHAQYRNTFTARGPGDDVGRAIERIVGRYDDSRATPAEIVQLAYGSVGEPGGPQAVKIAQRLRTIFGPDSPQWAAYKQGLLSHVVDAAEGTGMRPAGEAADRLEKLLNGTKGRGLAQVAFSPQERAQLTAHIDTLRRSVPVPLAKLDSVEKIVARISGRDGGPPATTTEIVDYLYGRTGAGDKGLSVRLAQRLKRDMTPDGFNQVRQGMWTKLTDAGEGKIEWGPQKVSQRLFEFLNESGKPLSHVLYTAEERGEMLKLASALKANIPIPGTTNPSGTAPMLAKIGAKLLHGALPLAGFTHGGIPGAVVGYAADRGLTSLANARAARQVKNLYYGRQPVAPADPRFAKAAVIAAQGGRERLTGR